MLASLDGKADLVAEGVDGEARRNVADSVEMALLQQLVDEARSLGGERDLHLLDGGRRQDAREDLARDCVLWGICLQEQARRAPRSLIGVVDEAHATRRGEDLMIAQGALHVLVSRDREHAVA